MTDDFLICHQRELQSCKCNGDMGLRGDRSSVTRCFMHPGRPTRRATRRVQPDLCTQGGLPDVLPDVRNQIYTPVRGKTRPA